MSHTLACGDVVAGCPAVVTADSEDEVLAQAAEHARTAHGMTSMDDATAQQVRDAVRPGG